MRLNAKEPVFGMGTAGGVSQPPMLAVFNGKYVELDPLWHVRGVGNNNPVKDKGNTKAKETVDFAKNKAKLLHWYVHTLHHLVGVVTYKPTSEPTSTLVGRFVLKTIFQNFI